MVVTPVPQATPATVQIPRLSCLGFPQGFPGRVRLYYEGADIDIRGRGEETTCMFSPGRDFFGIPQHSASEWAQA